MPNIDQHSRFTSLPPSLIKPIAPSFKKQNADEIEILNVLNSRMIYFINRVKDEEEKSRQLKSELDYLTQTWGAETRNVIKTSEPELQKARGTADYMSGEAAKSIAKSQKLDYKLDHLKKNLANEVQASSQCSSKINNLEQIVENSNDELDYLKKSLEFTKKDVVDYLMKTEKLNEQLDVLLNKLEDNTCKTLQVRSAIQTLEEQIPFLNAIHEKEIIEMKRLFDVRKVDPIQFYRNELKRAIDEIKNDFKELSDHERNELAAWYDAKANEMKAFFQKKTDPELPQCLKQNKKLKEDFEAERKNLIDLFERQKYLSGKLLEKEKELERQREKNAEILEKQDAKIMNKKLAIEDHLNDYEYILHNKGVTEYELFTLQRILDTVVGKSQPPQQKIQIPIVNLTRDELLLRLKREKAKIGDVHVSIAWDNMNDLDLHVIEPSGEEINFSHRKSASGGELDVDMNAGAQRSSEPCENVYWPKGRAPKGRYQILVVYYSNHGGNDPTNYLLLVELNGTQKEFSGKMVFGDKPHVWEFEIDE